MVLLLIVFVEPAALMFRVELGPVKKPIKVSVNQCAHFIRKTVIGNVLIELESRGSSECQGDLALILSSLSGYLPNALLSTLSSKALSGATYTERKVSDSFYSPVLHCPGSS